MELLFSSLNLSVCLFLQNSSRIELREIFYRYGKIYEELSNLLSFPLDHTILIIISHENPHEYLAHNSPNIYLKEKRFEREFKDETGVLY
jgi:hypothetical protein